MLAVSGMHQRKTQRPPAGAISSCACNRMYALGTAHGSSCLSVAFATGTAFSATTAQSTRAPDRKVSAPIACVYLINNNSSSDDDGDDDDGHSNEKSLQAMAPHDARRAMMIAQVTVESLHPDPCTAALGQRLVGALFLQRRWMCRKWSHMFRSKISMAGYCCCCCYAEAAERRVKAATACSAFFHGRRSLLPLCLSHDAPPTTRSANQSPVGRRGTLH